MVRQRTARFFQASRPDQDHAAAAEVGTGIAGRNISSSVVEALLLEDAGEGANRLRLV
jgi:hypothetical protein